MGAEMPVLAVGSSESYRRSVWAIIASLMCVMAVVAIFNSDSLSVHEEIQQDERFNVPKIELEDSDAQYEQVSSANMKGLKTHRGNKAHNAKRKSVEHPLKAFRGQMRMLRTDDRTAAQQRERKKSNKKQKKKGQKTQKKRKKKAKSANKKEGQKKPHKIISAHSLANFRAAMRK